MELEARRLVIVDPVTSEYFGEFEEGDRILKSKSIKAIEGQVLNFNKGYSFMKVYDDGMRKIRSKLTNAQFSFVCHLLPQMEYDTNILRNDNGSIMEVKDMDKVTNMCYESNRKLMTSLISLGIIGKWETGSRDNPETRFECFVMNPYIFHKGTRVYQSLLELFSKTGWNTEG